MTRQDEGSAAPAPPPPRAREGRPAPPSVRASRCSAPTAASPRSSSTTSPATRSRPSAGPRPTLRKLGPIEQAAKAGKLLAERAKKAGVEAVVFDRGGYQYHGRVKAFAEGVREGGLTV